MVNTKAGEQPMLPAWQAMKVYGKLKQQQLRQHIDLKWKRNFPLVPPSLPPPAELSQQVYQAAQTSANSLDNIVVNKVVMNDRTVEDDRLKSAINDALVGQRNAAVAPLNQSLARENGENQKVR